LFQTFFVVGPALGYLLGGSLLQIYVDLSTADLDPNLGPSHPLWVGAWWIGFLLSGAMAFACAIFIGSYPPALPSTTDKKKSVIRH
jgi:MFS family permease